MSCCCCFVFSRRKVDPSVRRHLEHDLAAGYGPIVAVGRRLGSFPLLVCRRQPLSDRPLTCWVGLLSVDGSPLCPLSVLGLGHLSEWTWQGENSCQRRQQSTRTTAEAERQVRSLVVLSLRESASCEPSSATRVIFRALSFGRLPSIRTDVHVCFGVCSFTFPFAPDKEHPCCLLDNTTQILMLSGW